MAILPRAGKYLNLEKVRVSEDPKTKTIHLTSKDPDIPGGFHISLNSGTETETKLRLLLEQRDMLGSNKLSNDVIPNYASFYNAPSRNKFFETIRSIHETPEELLRGDPYTVPLGVYSKSEEATWNILNFQNLLFIDDQVVDIVRNHVEYWSEEWSFVDLYGSVTVSPEHWDIISVSKKGEVVFANLLQKQKELLVRYGVSSFDEIKDSNETHKRIMVFGSAGIFDMFDRSIGIDSTISDLMFGKRRDQALALKEFHRLGIHFVLDINNSFRHATEDKKIYDRVAADCFPNSQLIRVQTRAEFAGYLSEIHSIIEYLGLHGRNSAVDRLYEV